MDPPPCRSAHSTEPLIEAIHQRLEAIGLTACLLFVLYVTCFPAVGASAAATPEAADLAASRPSLQDVVQNILLYFPLGLCSVLALRRRRVAWPWISPLVLVGSMLLAITAESLQASLPGRVSSRSDVICNAAGATAGLLVGILWRSCGPDFGRILRERVRKLPISCTCTVVGLLYAALAVVPFQLDLTPPASASLFDAQHLTAITPVRAARLWADQAPRVLVDHWLDIIGTLAAFVLLGGLSWWSLRREYRFRPLAALAVELWLVMLLTLTVMALQLLIRHGEFKSLTVMVSPVATLLGIAACVLLADRCEQHWRKLCAVAAAGAAMWVTANELSPFHFDLQDPGAFCWIPLQRSLDGVAALHASSDLLARFGRFAVLGILLGMALMGGRRRHSQNWLRQGLLLCTALAGGLEVLQLACPGRSGDVTHVLVAVAGAACGLTAQAYWMSLLQSARQPQGGPDSMRRRRVRTPKGHATARGSTSGLACPPAGASA